MASEYTYTKAVNVVTLTEEIEADPTIVTALSYIVVNGTALSIWFASALSGAEETALDAVVAAHTDDPYIEPGSEEPPPPYVPEVPPGSSAGGPFDVQIVAAGDDDHGGDYVQTGSTTYVDIPGLTVTTRDLGAPATYLIRFMGAAEHKKSGKFLAFRILVDGVEKASAQVKGDTDIDLGNIQHIEPSLSSGAVIKVQWKVETKTNIAKLSRRSLLIHGIPDHHIVTA